MTMAMHPDVPSEPGLVVLARQLVSPKGNTVMPGGRMLAWEMTMHKNKYVTCCRAASGCKTDACGGESGRGLRTETA
jgi:hypothetical protein